MLMYLCCGVGKALLASCAYSGRVAVAYTSDYARPHPTDTSKQLINLFVRVYECESTGQLVARSVFSVSNSLLIPQCCLCLVGLCLQWYKVR